MHGILRMVAALLFISIAWTFTTAQVELFPATHVSHPAGCHDHSPEIPSPTPTSYQCCVNGHHAAIPNAAFFLRPGAGQVCGLARSPELVLNVVPCFRSSRLLVSSSSPPGMAPLRI